MIRYITVPKDENAQNALNYNEATSEQLIEIHVAENEFKEIWDSGFFKLINSFSGSNIDTYETESITDIDVLKNILESKVFDNEKFVKIRLVREIKELINDAISRKTSINFYF